LVHDIDGCPPYLPEAELSDFIQSCDPIAGWVTEEQGDLVGQVALHSRSSRVVMGLASATVENPGERFGVVARLFVSPATRRSGVGRSLWQTAATHAVGLGLRPVLDVATQLDRRICLSGAVPGDLALRGCHWTAGPAKTFPF
jgi:GNAT superfamily N-acetyltransferase